MHRSGFLLCVFAAALALVGCDQIRTKIIERQAARNLQGDRSELLKDGELHVVLCGTGSPIADPERAGPCTAVLAGGHFFLVDVGPGSWEEVVASRLPRAQLEAVLLTHFHSDHIGELGEVNMQSWVAGRTNPLVVYGPPGVEKVVDGFREAYAFDNVYRVAHHGEEAMPSAAGQLTAHPVPLPSPGDSGVVFEADGLKVTTFAVDHTPVAPAVGYRFDYGGRSVVISGDTAPSSSLVKNAKGADVLIHEALAADMLEPVREYARTHGLDRWAKLAGDVTTYHTTPVQAAGEAKEAGVKALVYTHMVPPPANFLARRMFLAGTADAWDGKIVIGEDGMQIDLPPGSTEVEIAE